AGAEQVLVLEQLDASQLWRRLREAWLRHRLVESLRAAQAALEHELAAQRLDGERLRERARTLEQANRELEQFAAMAAHDLKEPLGIIMNYLRLLQRRYAGQLDAEADTFIEHALESAAAMKVL